MPRSMADAKTISISGTTVGRSKTALTGTLLPGHSGHCYHHHPNSILVLWLIMFMAHAVFHCFHKRNLKPERRGHTGHLFCPSNRPHHARGSMVAATGSGLRLGNLGFASAIGAVWLLPIADRGIHFAARALRNSPENRHTKLFWMAPQRQLQHAQHPPIQAITTLSDAVLRNRCYMMA